MSFDFNTIDFETALQKQDEFEVLPAGEYLAVIEKAETKIFEGSDNLTLFIQYLILDGDYEGSKVTSFFTLKGDDKAKVERGHSAISKLAKAIDEENGTKLLAKHNENFFINKILTIDVTVYQPKDKTKQSRNQVWKGYHKSHYDASKSPKRLNASYSTAVLNASDDEILF